MRGTGVVVYIVVFAVASSVVGVLLWPLQRAVASSVVGVLLWPLQRKVNVAIGKRYTRSGRFECALRAAPGSSVPMSPKWTHVLATPENGALTYRQGGPGGIRLFRRPPQRLLITGVSADGRHPEKADRMRINLRTEIATLHTSEGPVELAAMPGRMPALVAALGVSSG